MCQGTQQFYSIEIVSESSDSFNIETSFIPKISIVVKRNTIQVDPC